MQVRIEKNVVHGLPVHRAGETGFSLTELIITLVILSTLLAIAWPPFHTWQVNRKVEAQIRQMVSDINELRVRAMTLKQRHSIELNTSSYVFRSYASDDEPLTAGTIIKGGTYTVPYTLLRVNSGATTIFSGIRLELDPRGTMVTAFTDIIFVNYPLSASPYIDCINLKPVQTKPGKLNSARSSCDDR